METKTTELRKGPNKKIILGILAGVCALLAIYLGIAFFFTNHFRYGTTINGVNASYKTVDEVKKEITAKANDYELKLVERDGKTEVIKGSDIGYEYELGNDIENLKKKQSPYGWISGFFGKKDIELKEEVKYDEAALKGAIDKLDCLKTENVVEPQNAVLELKAGEFVITPEIKGNKLKSEEVSKGIINSIVNREQEIKFEELGYYENPIVLSDSKEIIDAKAKLDKYTATNITFNFGDTKELLSGATISTWLDVDENYNVAINEDYINSYADSLAASYNTYGSTRQFSTSLGTTATVVGGDYGWILDKESTIQAIRDAIGSGESVTIDPSYDQSAASRTGSDVGNTYVEINLTTQQVWYYKDGNLITSGSCVTGTANTQYATPQGTYVLKYTERNAILRGPGYESPVSFWMPFNWDIGLHDAIWRGSFGGGIYQYDGSHGCVNLPYSVAEAIFNNIEAGIPVICYY
ncbi:L,D-transpeptidase family protein [Clostridium culturomicium]|uniref:L,D-transpeptidase family protein n=1 Tax=Clostridium culturomicium TaxID=1499683 RepID=UPI00058AE545|nr:L,D-transpeptidase family protein [Clostridium culturomicium]